MKVGIMFVLIKLLIMNISFILQRPPSSSISDYGLGNAEARSPSSGGGTPGLLQPGSHISGDNISEAGKTNVYYSSLDFVKGRKLENFDFSSERHINRRY